MKYFMAVLSIFSLMSCSTTDCKHGRQTSATQTSNDVSESDKNGKMTLEKGALNMKKVKVAKPDGTLQCSQGKLISLSDMQKDLKEITVFSSKNQNDGMIRIQVCGAATGNHNVYEILEADLDKAIGYGFKRWNK